MYLKSYFYRFTECFLAEYQGQDAPLSNVTDPIIKIEEEALLLNRVEWVKRLLKGLEPDIHKDDYTDLQELIIPIEQACIVVLEAARFKREFLKKAHRYDDKQNNKKNENNEKKEKDREQTDMHPN